MLLQPTKLTAVIEGIILEESPQECGFAGDQLILKLKGVEEEDVHTGFVVTDPREPLKNVQFFHAQVCCLFLLGCCCFFLLFCCSVFDGSVPRSLSPPPPST